MKASCGKARFGYAVYTVERVREHREGRGGLIVNRAPAPLRHSVCAVRVPRPKPQLPEKVGTPLRKAA
jgi:hypothetical protein